MNTASENFNDFIIRNPKEAAVIYSMRDRLIDYGMSMMRQEVAPAILANNNLKDIRRAPPKNEKLEGIIRAASKNKIINVKDLKVIQMESGHHALTYILATPTNKLIGMELNFNKYKLHWGICIYSKKEMLGWSDKYNFQSLDDSNKFFEYEDLIKHAEQQSVVINNDYQNDLRGGNENDEILSIVAIQPTGDRDKDSIKLVNTLEEIILKLMGENPDGNNIVSLSNQSEKEPEWEEIFAGYRKGYLLEPPNKIRTFLEISGIADKENYISNILGFLLNEKEPHPFGNIFFRALYKIYKRKKPDTLTKKGKEILDNETLKNTIVESVHREHSTSDKKRIDLLIETSDYVMAIEHKIYADLYNELEFYKETAERKANEKGKDKEVACVVLCPFKLSSSDEKKAQDHKFVSITYQELFAEVTNHFNEVSVYHQDKHFLYIQLFYDLFKTIENLTEEHRKKESFEELMIKHSGFTIQAIHSFIDYYTEVLGNVEKKLKEELPEPLQSKICNWCAEEDKAWYIGGYKYVEANRKYIPTRRLAYDFSAKHSLNTDGESLAIDTGFDWSSGKWMIEFFFRNAEYSKNHLTKMDEYFRDNQFAVLDHGKHVESDNRYRINLDPINLDPQGTQEKTEQLQEETEQLIARVLVDAIHKLEEDN